jgi:hypothetical protein
MARKGNGKLKGKLKAAGAKVKGFVKKKGVAAIKGGAFDAITPGGPVTRGAITVGGNLLDKKAQKATEVPTYETTPTETVAAPATTTDTVVKPAVQTSNMATNAVTSTMDRVNSTIGAKAASTPTPTATTTPAPEVVIDSGLPVDGETPPPDKGDPNVYGTQAWLEAENGRIDEQLSSLTKIYDEAISTLDSNTASMVASIKASYEQSANEQRAANQAALGGVNVSGIVSGRSRYASEIQQGIVAAEQSAGIQRLASLTAQEQQAIMEVQSAADEKRFSMVIKKGETLKSIQDEKRKLVVDMYDFNMKQAQLKIQQSQETRAQKGFDIEYPVKLAESVVGSMLPELTGGAGDKAIIDAKAAELGISPDVLSSTIFAAQEEIRNNLPAIAREYEYAKSKGYTGSFMGYQSLVANLSNEIKNPSPIDLDAATDLGVPGIAGMTTAEVIADLKSSTPASWFNKTVVLDKYGQKPVLDKKGAQKYDRKGQPMKEYLSVSYTPTAMQTYWNKFRMSSEAETLISAYKSAVEANSSGGDWNGTT